MRAHNLWSLQLVAQQQIDKLLKFPKDKTVRKMIAEWKKIKRSAKRLEKHYG